MCSKTELTTVKPYCNWAFIWCVQRLSWRSVCAVENCCLRNLRLPACVTDECDYEDSAICACLVSCVTEKSRSNSLVHDTIMTMWLYSHAYSLHSAWVTGNLDLSKPVCDAIVKSLAASICLICRGFVSCHRQSRPLHPPTQRAWIWPTTTRATSRETFTNLIA